MSAIRTAFDGWRIDTNAETKGKIVPSARMTAMVIFFLAMVMLPQSRAQDGAEAVVIENINVALAIMQRSGGWSTGMGCMLSSIPGTSAKDLSLALEAVTASIWVYEVETRCGADICPGPELDLIQQGLNAEFNQCVSYGQLEYNLKRRRAMFSTTED